MLAFRELDNRFTETFGILLEAGMRADIAHAEAVRLLSIHYRINSLKLQEFLNYLGYYNSPLDTW